MKISKISLLLLTTIFCASSSSSFAGASFLYTEQKRFEQGDLVSGSTKEALKDNAENTKSNAQKEVEDKKSEYQGEPLTDEQKEILANDKAKLQNQAQTKKKNAKNQVNYLREHPLIIFP